MVKKTLTDIIKTTQDFEAIKKRFEYAFGGTEQANEQLEFVKKTANELGLELMGAAEGYSQLAAATKNLNMSTEETQQVFTGAANAIAAMGLSAQEQNSVFLALSQIAGKGKVSMEELRKQLGEKLTPAMGIAAKSMGVTTSELEKMVESGISAEKFLPKFGAALEDAFKKDAIKNIDSISGKMNILSNQFKEMLNGFGEGGVAQAFKSVIDDVSGLMSWLEDEIKSFDSGTTEAIKDAFISVYETVKEVFSQIFDSVGTFFTAINDVGSALTGMATDTEESFSIIKAVFDGISIFIGAFRDGVSAIGIVFDLVVGSILKGLSAINSGLAKISFGDISKGFEQAAKDLDESAQKHFGNAEKRAMEFESKTVAALEKVGETEAQRFARFENDARTAYENATQAAINAAENAKIAKENADKAIGTSAEESAKKQAKEAEKAANKAGFEAEKTQRSWIEAYEKIGGAADDELAEKLAKPLKDVGTQAEQVAVDLSKIPLELGRAKASAQEMGIDLSTAMSSISTETRGALENIESLTAGYELLAQEGYDAAQILKQATDNLISKAKNTADIDAIKAKFKELGDSGKLSMAQVEQGILDADIKLAELRGSIDPTALAFKKLGIQTKEALASSANGLIQAYETAKESGLATADQLAQGFKRAADAALLSGNEQARAWVEANAAAHDYKIAIDEVGKASLQVAESSSAIDAVAAGVKDLTTVTKEHSSANKENTDTVEKNAEATKKAEAGVRSYQKMKLALVDTTNLNTEAEKNFNAAMQKTWNGNDAENSIRRVIKASKEYEQSILDAVDATERLNQKVSDGTITFDDIAQASQAAYSKIAELDSATLDNLNNSIDKAKQKLSELKQQAQDTKEALEAELAGLKGNDSAKDELEQKRKIRDLQEKINQAQKAGNRDLIADYQQALEIQKQIFAEKQKQKADKSTSAKESSSRSESTPRTESSRSERSSGDVIVKLDTGSIRMPGMAHQAGDIRKLAEAVGQQIINQMKNEAQRGNQ